MNTFAARKTICKEGVKILRTEKSEIYRKGVHFVMQELLSVIIPIYNVEKYLRQCLDSVLQQTYTNLEIILVDDGSPDNCPQICDEYAARESRVKVIHKINGGVSSARNAGLDAATGEWIGFVDSDDWLLPDMYEKLYNAVKCENADLAICGYQYVDENNEPLSYNISVIKDEVLTKSDAFSKLVEKRYWYYITVYNKIYAKKIFNRLRFPIGRIHEDEFTAHHIFDVCEKIVTVSDILYMYIQRKDSTMGKPFFVKRFDGVDALYDRYKFFKAKGLNKHAKLSLRKGYRVVISGLKQFDYKTHEQTIKPFFDKMFWLLVRERDLRAVKLFIYHHAYKTISTFEKGAKS